jgi:hypothetical protein
LVLQFQEDAFHVQEASGQAPKDYLQEDERQGAPLFRLKDGLEQRFSNIHLKEKGRFPALCLELFPEKITRVKPTTHYLVCAKYW